LWKRYLNWEGYKVAYFPTISGGVPIEKTGRILPHEHLVLYPSRIEEKYYDVIKKHHIPLLKNLVNDYGCDTIVEVTARRNADGGVGPGDKSGYIKDNINLCREICTESGINLVLSTGFYREIKRPVYFFGNTVTQLADEMIRDIEDGIDDSGVKAGIIKIAIDDMNSPADIKLLDAAAIAQKATGIAITTHTCSRDTRLGTLNHLENAGVDPERIVLGHADAHADANEILTLAKRNCRLLFTIWGITDAETIGGRGTISAMHSADLAAILSGEGHIDKLLFSTDYTSSIEDGKLVPALYGIPDRNFCYAFTFTVPALKKVGLTDEQIDKIMVDNPRRMLTKR